MMENHVQANDQPNELIAAVGQVFGGRGKIRGTCTVQDCEIVGC